MTGRNKHIEKFSRSSKEWHKGQHRFEHWYVDNQVYFITARCRDRFPAFTTGDAKTIFWDRFNHYTNEARFTPWITSLIDNHYHTLGYCEVGEKLKTMMQRIHGSVAKMVNDTLPGRHIPFWREGKRHDYFDGCIRDETQCRRAYRYVLTQCRRHGIGDDYRDYPHTHVAIDLDRGVKRALELGAFMGDVP